MNRLLRRRDDEQGAVLVFVSIAMVVLLGSTALAVDIGQLTNRNRDLQAVADAVALDAARGLAGGEPAVLTAAEQSAQRNDFPFPQLTVEVGRWTGSAFQPGASPVDAVRVSAHDTVNYRFAPGSQATSRPATAVQTATAGFSVGSFLASIPPGGNHVLAAIFGKSFGATVLNYDGLANAHVTLRQVGLNFPVTALSPSELLNTSVSLRDFFLASAAALSGSNTAAANVLNAMAASVSSTATVELGRLIAAHQGGEAAAADVHFNVLRLLTGAAFLMDGTHTVTIPGTTLNLAGLGDVNVSLQVTEPVKTVFGPVGTTAETAQVRLTVEPTIRFGTQTGTVNQCTLGDTLSSLLGLNLLTALECLLRPVWRTVNVADLSVTLPIEVAAAGASATLEGITCGNPAGMTLIPELQPTTLKAAGNVTISSPILGNVMQASASLDGSTVSSPGPQTFTESEFGTSRTVGSSAIGLGSSHPLTFGSVSLLGYGVPLAPVLNPLGSTLAGAVNPVLTTLTTSLLDPLNRLLGLHLAGADLTALAVACGGVRLAE